MLETSFILFRLPPYHRNFRKRLVKSPKLYFVDTGLLCHLLQIHGAGELARHAMRGAVFENLVVSELSKSCHHGGRSPRLAFWRDHRGTEIDLVVESPSGVAAVEVKSGVTVAGDFFKGLRYWKNLAGAGDRCVLVYGGDRSYERSGVAVRSWRHWP